MTAAWGLVGPMENGSRRFHDGLLRSAAAATYFQTLDGALASWATQMLGRDDVGLNYLLTTTLIEQRAMQVYPLYKAATRHPAVKEELGKIVAEEQSHRRSIEAVCTEALAAAGADLVQPRAIEDRLFEGLLGALERELATSSAGIEPARREDAQTSP